MGAAADKLQAKLESLIERACKALILEINRELRKSGTGTPVDTGHARASWIPRRTMTPPIGTVPEVMPLAKVIMSGTTP